MAEDKRKLNIIWTKAGTGSPTTKLSIPISWCYDMGLSKEERKVEIIYNKENKEIIIRKEN